MSGDLLLMPRLGETMEEGIVRAWLVAPGKPFRRGDVIAEIETDKTTVELPALADGVITDLFVKEGDVIAVGKPLARLAGGGSATSSQEPSATGTASGDTRIRESRKPPARPPATAGRVAASPAARRLAQKLDLSLNDIPGSGPNGRRQGWDVRAAAKAAKPLAIGEGGLHYVARGEGMGLPVVFLHGFGANLDGWTNVQNAIALHRPTLALDLPGHGRSVDNPATGFTAMASAVAETIDAAGIPRLHFVGHSMGGGVSTALALAEPARVASLTLFAPGGFGPDLNRLLLGDFAEARREDEIAALLPDFFGTGAHIPRHLARLIGESRSEPAHGEALLRALAAILDGNQQRVLDLGALAATGIPVRVIWGDHDKVLPFDTTDRLPPVFALHRFRGIGHMPHVEMPRETIRLIHETIRGE